LTFLVGGVFGGVISPEHEAFGSFGMDTELGDFGRRKVWREFCGTIGASTRMLSPELLDSAVSPEAIPECGGFPLKSLIDLHN
jgi:hypothetical protein